MNSGSCFKRKSGLKELHELNAREKQVKIGQKLLIFQTWKGIYISNKPTEMKNQMNPRRFTYNNCKLIKPIGWFKNSSINHCCNFSTSQNSHIKIWHAVTLGISFVVQDKKWRVDDNPIYKLIFGGASDGIIMLIYVDDCFYKQRKDLSCIGIGLEAESY
nr:hypothetical protein CFP56_22962 [Quercus suber]